MVVVEPFSHGKLDAIVSYVMLSSSPLDVLFMLAHACVLTQARGESKDSIMAHIMEECRKLIPCFDPAEIIHSFAGVRAKNSTGDWVVRPAKGHPSFVHAAGCVCYYA